MSDAARFSQRLAEQAPDGPLLLALSGGLDSSLLLHLLVQAGLAPRLCAVHIDHQLQADSRAWSRFCGALADKYGIALTIEPVTVSMAEGLEAGARDARYQVLLPLARAKGATLVLAHHRNDQAETVLFRLLRGAGVQGLSAMGQHSQQQGVTLWRPLLGLGRHVLEKWGAELSLNWLEDPSNQDQSLRRNYLRHTILPALRERWPGADATLARAAEHMAEANQLLTEVAVQDAASIGVSGAVLPLPRLAELSLARQRNVLRWWLQKNRASAPSAAVLEQIRVLHLAAEDSQARVEWGGYAVRVYQGALHFARREAFQPWQGDILWPEGEAPPDLPRWRWTQHAVEGAVWVLRPAGDIQLRSFTGALTLRRNGLRQKIKELWRAAGVPPWHRRQWPLLCRDGEVVSVPLVGLADGEALERAERWYLLPAGSASD